MTEENVVVNDAFMANALRQSGYTTYSAICDIVDNSLEKNVKSTVVKILREGNGDSINALKIIDDGSGMSYSVLREALSLGSKTGKTKENNLGYYGVGLKTASLSIGKCVEVWTKEANSKKVYYAKLDLDTYYIGGKLKVSFENNCKNELLQYAVDNLIEDHGTIVRISKLDKIATKNYTVFKQKMKSVIGETFNKFIINGNCKFKLGTETINYVDIVGNLSGIKVERLSPEGANFKVNNDKISYNAWYIPSDAQPNGSLWLPRGSANSGLYLYRNNRLVGKGLSFGLLGFSTRAKHDLYNGLRIELFMDGNADDYMGSTYCKMVAEKDKDSLNQVFYEKMINELKQYTKIVKDKDSKIKNDSLKEEDQKILDNIADVLNRNIHVSRPDVNTKDNKTPRKKGTPKEPKKPIDRHDPIERVKKMFKFTREHLGENGPIVEYTDTISINIDHAFYQEIYSKMENNYKWAYAVMWASEWASRKELNLLQGNGDQLSTVIMEADSKKGEKMSEIIAKLCPDYKDRHEEAA